MAHIRIVAEPAKPDGDMVLHTPARVTVVLDDGSEQEVPDVVSVAVWTDPDQLPQALLHVYGPQLDLFVANPTVQAAPLAEELDQCIRRLEDKRRDADGYDRVGLSYAISELRGLKR